MITGTSAEEQQPPVHVPDVEQEDSHTAPPAAPVVPKRPGTFAPKPPAEKLSEQFTARATPGEAEKIKHVMARNNCQDIVRLALLLIYHAENDLFSAIKTK